jgi:hypothetical protein
MYTVKAILPVLSEGSGTEPEDTGCRLWRAIGDVPHRPHLRESMRLLVEPPDRYETLTIVAICTFDEKDRLSVIEVCLEPTRVSKEWWERCFAGNEFWKAYKTGKILDSEEDLPPPA